MRAQRLEGMNVLNGGNNTNNPNIHSKRIFNFCNIPITDNILEFHNYENLVSKTSSFMQVRNKIQKYDKNKYKSYYYLIDKKF